MGNTLNSVATICQCGCNPSSLTKKPPAVSSFLDPKKAKQFNSCSTQGLHTPVIEERHPKSISNISTVDNQASHLSSAKSYTNGLASIDEFKPRKMGPKDFILERTLGKGSVGTVLLVRREGELELFAMKVMRKKDLQRDQLYENVILERHILQVNKHPFIVHLKHAFQSQTKLYFVMEYLCGGDLYSLIRKRKGFSVSETRFYAAEVLLALDYLHTEMNVIYRDLKPENILISAEGHVKLSDFGLSKQGEKAYTFAGTPEYLAPEIFLAKGYTKAADYWSLGVLIYEMLVGKPPFTSENRNISQIEKLILINKPVYPETMEKEAVDLIQKLLETNPRKRFQAEEIKNHEFFKGFDWVAVEGSRMPAPIEIEKIRARKSSKLGASMLEEEENDGNNFVYLPGISYNATLET